MLPGIWLTLTVAVPCAVTAALAWRRSTWTGVAAVVAGVLLAIELVVQIPFVGLDPLQAVMGISALVNGGKLIPPTFLKRDQAEADRLAKRVIKAETADKMRYLMRLNVEKGTATRANVMGYYVGGKTGTSEKVVGGRYSKTKVLTSFTAILPADKPRYLLLIMLDEPQGLPETHGFSTSGWNAVPVGAKVIERVAPLLDLRPRFDLPKADQLLLVSAKETR